MDKVKCPKHGAGYISMEIKSVKGGGFKKVYQCTYKDCNFNHEEKPKLNEFLKDLN